MFFLTLAPTSSVVPIASEVGAERRMYLPLAALVVLAGFARWLGLDRLRARWPARSRTLPTRPCAYAAACGRGPGGPDDVPQPGIRHADVALGKRRGAAAARAGPICARVRATSPRIATKRPSRSCGKPCRTIPTRAPASARSCFSGARAEAIDVLDPFVRANPSNPNRIPARMLLGQALLSQGRIDEGANQFRAVLGLDPQQHRGEAGHGDGVADSRGAIFSSRGTSAQALRAGARGAAPRLRATRRRTICSASRSRRRVSVPKPRRSSARRCGSTPGIRRRTTTWNARWRCIARARP